MDIKDLILSYGRCTTKPEFFDDFYARLFASSPHMAPFFKDTPMEKQKAILRDGVNFALQFAKGAAVGEMAMNRLSKVHGKKQKNVNPLLYTLWLKSLVETIRKHDPQFTPQLEYSWNEAMQTAIDHMSKNRDV